MCCFHLCSRRGAQLSIAGALIVFSVALRLRGAGRMAAMVEGVALIVAAPMATASLRVLFATSAFPYRDALLDCADGILMPPCAWTGMFAMLHTQGAIVRVMGVIYCTLLWQPVVPVAVLKLS